MPRNEEISKSVWITGDTQIVTGRTGLVRGVLLTAGDSADASIALYDGTSTDDTPLFTLKVKMGTTLDIDMLRRTKEYISGVYANLKGAGSKALIWYT